MFLDLKKSCVHACLIWFYVPRKKFIHWCYIYKNVGILVLMNFKTLLLAQILLSNQISYTKMFVILLPKW